MLTGSMGADLCFRCSCQREYCNVPYLRKDFLFTFNACLKISVVNQSLFLFFFLLFLSTEHQFVILTGLRFLTKHKYDSFIQPTFRIFIMKQSSHLTHISLAPFLWDMQTVHTHIRRHRTRRLTRVSNVCQLNVL